MFGENKAAQAETFPQKVQYILAKLNDLLVYDIPHHVRRDMVTTQDLADMEARINETIKRRVEQAVGAFMKDVTTMKINTPVDHVHFSIDGGSTTARVDKSMMDILDDPSPITNWSESPMVHHYDKPSDLETLVLELRAELTDTREEYRNYSNAHPPHSPKLGRLVDQKDEELNGLRSDINDIASDLAAYKERNVKLSQDNKTLAIANGVGEDLNVDKGWALFILETALTHVTKEDRPKVLEMMAAFRASQAES